MEQRIDSDCGEHRHVGLRHILPFLAIPVALAMMRNMSRRMYTRMGGLHRAEWKNGVPPMFAELHRRAHAAEAENQPAAVTS
jgi:hypothetical protein